MADLLFASTSLHGHVGPMLPIARELVARGHRIRWYTGSEFGPAVAATGCEFLPASDAVERASGESHRAAAATAAASGGRRPFVWDLENVFLPPARVQAEELRAALAARPAGALVTDSLLFAGRLVHELGGPPWATVGVIPLMTYSRDTAPFGTARPPAGSALGRIRDRAGNAWHERVTLRRANRRLRRARASFGLAGRESVLRATMSPYLHLQHGVADFEYPRRDLPPQVHFVGALANQPRDRALPPWWTEVTGAGRPVVLVTQGTYASDDLGQLVLPTLRGLAGCEVLVVATVGSGRATTIGAQDDLPANARVAEFLPYHRLLAHTSVMVTNGGYGGVQLALSHGVPLVVAGASEDKPEVAARVAWHGVGSDLGTARPAPAAIRQAVLDVMTAPGFRRRAQAMKERYRERDAPAEAATLIERLAAPQ